LTNQGGTRLVSGRLEVRNPKEGKKEGVMPKWGEERPWENDGGECHTSFSSDFQTGLQKTKRERSLVSLESTGGERTWEWKKYERAT